MTGVDITELLLEKKRKWGKQEQKEEKKPPKNPPKKKNVPDISMFNWWLSHLLLVVRIVQDSSRK